MKRFAGLLMAAVLLAVCLTAVAENYNYVYFTGAANVRTGPGLSYASIGSIDSGSTLPYLQSASRDSRGVTWYKVSFSGTTGWASSKHCTLTNSSGTSVYASGGSTSVYGNSYVDGGKLSGAWVCATANANVRSGPGLGYALLDAMEEGEYAAFLGNTAYDSRGVCWYNVKFDGSTGWVSSAYTKVTGTASDVYYGYVMATGGDSNVRTGAGLGYSSIGCLYEGESAAYLGNSMTDARGVLWYQISFDGRSAWVSSRYTTLY